MLHGKIQVNDQTVGYWQARRLYPSLLYPEALAYRCEVSCLTSDGPRTVYFEVDHKEEDGALTLAQKVLVEGHRLMTEVLSPQRLTPTILGDYPGGARETTRR